MVSYGILDAWWHLDSSCHKCPFCKIILNDVSVKFFTGSDQIAAMSCMRWTVLVACFQDSNKDGKKYSDQLSNFLVYGMLSFKSTPGFIKTTWFFSLMSGKKPFKKANFCCFKLVSNKETWWALLSWVLKNPIYFNHVKCHGQFLSTFWCNCEYLPW